MTLTREERAFALYKSRLVMEAMASNLVRLGAMPSATSAQVRERSGTYVCVGAGPSLSTTGPDLVRLQQEGAVICTVNTALRAVNKYVVPDVVLAREVVDVSSHMQHPAGLRVLDLAASPKVWDAARAMGPCAFFIAAAAQNLELSAQLEERPLFGGPAALTAMVALCEAWGAARVILVGCDLALADDGTSYAVGSAFDGQRATISESGIATNSGAGFAMKQAQHEAGGTPPPPTHEATIEIDRWGGGRIRTTAQWADQIPWLADFSDRHQDIDCIDATGAGARKPGWWERDASEVTCAATEMTRVPAFSSVPVGRRAAAVQHLRSQCESAIALSATVLDAEGCVVAVPGYLSGMDHVEAAAAGGMLTNLESLAAPADKVRRAYSEELPEAARRLLAILG